MDGKSIRHHLPDVEFWLEEVVAVRLQDERFLQRQKHGEAGPIELLLRRDLVSIVNLFTCRQELFSLTVQPRHGRASL